MAAFKKKRSVSLVLSRVQKLIVQCRIHANKGTKLLIVERNKNIRIHVEQKERIAFGF